MVNTFQLNKKYAEWAERTVYNFFKRKRKKTGMDIFYFGSQVGTVKRDKSDAPTRPDFILLKNKHVKELERRYHLKFNNVPLRKLMTPFQLSRDDKISLKKNPEYWLTKIPDKEPLIRDLVKRSCCMLEIKSGFGIFNRDKYEQGRLNIMVPTDFKRRIRKMQKKFKVRFRTYAAYVMLDCAYIANMADICKNGSVVTYAHERMGTGEVKKDKYYALPFNKAHWFAKIKGVVVRGQKKLTLKAKPFFEINNGTIRFSLKMKLGKLKQVNKRVLKQLRN